ncbi:MAG: sulfatase activating formylglycine-generating enzyme [Chlamydiales bacterium]|jgi:formylglycine-generating enzyme required for sulfatase activity
MRHNHTFITLFLIAALSSSTAAQDESSDVKPARELAPAKAASQPKVVVSPELLRERSEYAALDKQAVEALARAAGARWPGEFSGFTYQRVERFSAGGVSHWISIWSHGKTGLEFVLVPGGRFQMGSPAGEANRKEDEVQHWVSLDPFLIARTECTQAAWARLAKAAGLDGDTFDGAAQRPKAGMSPESVEAWCRQAHLTLPTEAQWEFMCRAGTTSTWAMGDNKIDLQRIANLGSAECPQDWIAMSGITEPWHDGYGIDTAPVGMFAANGFGLFDVHGNVCEWTRDPYLSYEVPVESGTGRRPGISGERIARGGNGGGDAGFARSAGRFHCGPGISPGANHGFGFRPALDLPFPVSLEGWPSETFALPPGFAPDLPSGLESLRFAPGWRDPSTEDFWSYAIVMWIDEPAPDAARVSELLEVYYDGLMSAFASSAGKDIGSDPAQVELVRSAPNHFEAEMHVIDAFATFEAIDLRVLVDTVAETDERTVLRIRLSPQPEEHEIWRSLETAIASIRKP